MKSDIDQLMRDRDLSALMVTTGENYSPFLDYFVNGAPVTHGTIIKKVGEEPLFICNGMELEEARKSGLALKTTNELGIYDVMKEHTDRTDVQVIMWGRYLQAAEVAGGRVGIYGHGMLNEILALTERARDLLPDYEFVGEAGRNLFTDAFLTKDAQEIQQLIRVGELTNEVMALTWDFIADHTASDDETVVNADGQPLTIGDVKRFVRRALLDRGLEDTGMIFAQGRDGGFPHSRGEESQALKLGQAIVFDLFPREMGGGYHHDMTRTWSIGYATPAVQKAYDDVMEALDVAVETFAVGKLTATMQDAVLDLFEAKGHPTTRSDSKTMTGYVHSLGHGIGLNIHEGPSISHLRRDDVFAVGNCVTIEPGLYYPDEGYGVRVEDAYIVTEQGELLSITPFRKDLILPLKR
jgi:Xaa-Pro aminopeptidase